MPPSMCAADIIISIWKEPFFSFKMQSKYTLKRMNYDMFSPKNSESYNNYFVYKNILIFKIQSDHNIHQNCTIFSKFSHVAYAPEPLAHMSANKL